MLSGSYWILFLFGLCLISTHSTQEMVNWWFGLVVWDSNRGTSK